jgi:hypothetical protein
VENTVGENTNRGEKMQLVKTPTEAKREKNTTLSERL